MRYIKVGALCFVCISQLERTSDSEKKNKRAYGQCAFVFTKGMNGQQSELG